MEGIIISVYTLIALATHYYIYRVDKDVKPFSAEIVSLLWPIAVLVICLLWIDYGIKMLFRWIRKICNKKEG